LSFDGLGLEAFDLVHQGLHLGFEIRNGFSRLFIHCLYGQSEEKQPSKE
jgi:hypothetical protein